MSLFVEFLIGRIGICMERVEELAAEGARGRGQRDAEYILVRPAQAVQGLKIPGRGGRGVARAGNVLDLLLARPSCDVFEHNGFDEEARIGS